MKDLEYIKERIDEVKEELQYLRGKVDSMTWRMLVLGSISGGVSASITAILFLLKSVN